MKSINRSATLLTFIFLAGCSDSPQRKIPEVRTLEERGGDPSPAYQKPDDYAFHRNQQTLFKSTGGNIAFTDHGEGDALVMIHGVPTSSWMEEIPEQLSGFILKNATSE